MTRLHFLTSKLSGKHSTKPCSISALCATPTCCPAWCQSTTSYTFEAGYRTLQDSLDKPRRTKQRYPTVRVISSPVGSGKTSFAVAKELDDRAHSIDPTKIQMLSIDAKSVLGGLADVVQANRIPLLNGATSDSAGEGTAKVESGVEETLKHDSGPDQAKLL